MTCRYLLTSILVSLFSTIYSLQAQTLFTYGTKSVSRDEFLRAYTKNNAGEKPTAQSYKDYLDLFSKFKIKVQAAHDMKLDTLSNLKAELQNFRSQIAENYLNDEGNIQELIDEVYDRCQKDIYLAHIFIPVNLDDSSGQLQKAQGRINKAHQLLKQKSFEQVALEFSEDPSVKVNKGEIGYVTVFVLPYELENIVYNLRIGEYSQPVRSAAGYHIFKNIRERRAVGRIQVAQILLAFPPDIPNGQELVRKRADSVVAALLNGADFKTAAVQVSNDNLSYQNGGELPEFGVGRYEPLFEAAAFALEKDGQISKPVQTAFGYHIIKRLSHKPPQKDKHDQQWREQVKQQILQNDRMEIARAKLVKSIKQKTKFRMLPYNQKSLWRFTDSILAIKKVPTFNDLNSNTGLFAFSKETVRVRDWRNYLESIRNIESLTSGKTNDQILEQFIETSAVDYYRNHLEEFNKDFVFQLNEFRDGNLLFEVMQRKVWDAASADTVGLKNFYEKNKDKYWWENSADAIIFTCPDEKTAEELKAKLKNKITDWRKSVEANNTIQADSGRFELGQIPVPDRTSFSENLITANVKNEVDNSITFAYILKVRNNREPRTYEDARGFVINDYQLFLEEQWVATLKKKYPITVNTAVFESLPK